MVSCKDFQKGQRVLLYDYKLHIFPSKLKSRGDFKAVGHVLKDSWQRKNPEEKNSPRHFAQHCEIFANHCKIFAEYAKPFSNSKVSYC